MSRLHSSVILSTVIVLISVLSLLTSSSTVRFNASIPSTGIISLDWLHTQGRKIVDSNGREVLLHGANFIGLEYGAWNQHTENDYQQMRAWGFNVVRLPIAWSYLEPEPGLYDLTYLSNYIDRDIAWAKKNKLYVILDLHQWWWSPHFRYFSQDGEAGKGFPAWAVNSYPDTQEGWAQAVTDFWLGKASNGTIPTATNPSLQEKLVTIWEILADRYANENAIAGYDLFNEPFQGKLSSEDHASLLYQFYEKVAFEIRGEDLRHIIIYEHTVGHDTNKYARKLPINNVIFSFHFYTLNDQYNGDLNFLESSFNDYYSPCINWTIPVFIGEFNSRSNYPNFDVWIFDALNLFDRNGLGWTWWSYSKSNYELAALCYHNGTQRSELTRFLAIH